jgi:hypothetical protein
MRLSLLAVAAGLVLCAPVHAADSLADQAAYAVDVFAGGAAAALYAETAYGRVAFDNIAGQWASLTGPDPRSGADSYGAAAEKACASSSVLTLASPDFITLTISGTPLDTEFRQIYTQIAGTTFSEFTEPHSYFAAVGLGPDKRGPEADRGRALALSLANGVVQIYRPSPDILVMTRDKGYPRILARCPKP